MPLPENINLNKPEKYTLTIRIEPHAFSFLIQDTEDLKCFNHQRAVFMDKGSLLNNIQRIIFENDFLTENFKQVNVVLVSENYELIPSSYYNQTSFKKLYEFTHNNKGTHVLTSEHSIPRNKLIFGFDNETYLFLKRSLSSYAFSHHISPLVNYFSSKQDDIQREAMFVYFHESFMDIVCFGSDGEIIHTHTYDKEHEENLLYYILNTWEKLNFDQAKSYLQIYGTPPGIKLEDTLKKYIKRVKTIDSFDMLADFGEKTRNMPMDIIILSK